MPNARLPRSLFFLLVSASALYIFYYYPRLPERVASHFGGNGTPNGWQTKPVFLAFHVGAIVLATIISFGVPRMIGALPVQLVNLPNREYWLAPERRAETLDFFAAYFAWFGCVIVIVILVAENLAIRANLDPARGFDTATMWWTLGGLFVFLPIWIFRLFSRFLNKP